MPPLTVHKNLNYSPSDEIEEPDWSLLMPTPPDGDEAKSERWREVARKEWARLVKALRAAETLAPENRHQIQRLVLSYVRYDLAASKMFAEQAVVPSKITQVPQLNLWQVEMRAAESDATTAEMELGIPPRRRGSVTKVKAKPKQTSAADGYLSSVKKA
jgi:phage terminase small subunit